MTRESVTYTQEIAELICDRLANGESLNAICKSDGMPTEGAVRAWARVEGRNDFATKYARSREHGLEVMAEQLLDIADETSVAAKYDGDEVTLVLDAVAVARNRLRVDTRKWFLSKLAPKKYGEKVVHNLNIRRSAADMTDDELAERAASGSDTTAGGSDPA